MSLQREENNLRRAQARFDKVSRRSKQFQIDFRREANSRGRFHTRAYIVRGEKTHHGGRGIVHKFANAKYRIQGDKPSVTRTIKSWQPKTFKGKLFKANVRAVNFAVHDVAQTAVDTGLAVETGGIKTADTAQREVRNKLKQKYTREAVDDYHRGVFLVGRTAVDAVKGTHNHLKTKKQYKLEKAKLQLKKADNKLYKAKTQKPKMAATKADLKKAKAEYKARIVKDKGNTLRKAMNKRRLQAYKQTKRELNFERKQLKTEQQFRVKELRNQKKITRNSRPGLLALKPASYSVKRMKASAWQKAVNEDQDNDMLHAIDSAKRRIAEPVKDKISKPQWLQREEKKRDRLSDEKSKSNKKLNRQENKLNENHDKYKQRKKRKPKNKKTKKTVAERFKSAFKFVKNVYEKEVKKFFAAIAVPILIIFLVFAFIIMIFSSIVSGGGFTLGTYAAQDYDLSEAEKYYTELVYNFNQKILKVSDTSDWKKGLTAFGANKKDLKDKPDNWYWGKSSIYDWKPQYDFDCYKLWAFLSAYYYDFDADDNGDIKYWKFKSDTEDLLEYIFNAEYEFVYWYDNKSRWEELDTYVYFGGGSSTDGSYYYCEQSASKSNGAWTYKFKPTSYTSELGQYLDGDGYCYMNSNYRVLNPNEDYALTGYYVLDNRYYADSAHTKPPFYWIDDNGKFFFQNHDGDNQYRSFYGWENDDAWFMITESDARSWTGDSNCSALYGYVQKQYWKTECNLYYNVKQKKTFDEVIEDKLKSMSHKTERWQYYNLLVGNEDGNTLYGNHQTLHNLLPEPSIRDYSLKREFGYEMTGWNEESDGLYQGIKVYADSGTKLKMPFSGKITDVDTDDNKITIRKDDVQYWYDGTGGTKRDTEVTIANAVLINDYEEGDSIKEGKEFAKTTAGNVNFHIYIMATFTEKAAKELVTRITNELAVRNIYVNVNEMYIGTFHSLCLRIIKDNLEFTQLKKNYRLLDSFDQKYLVFRNIQKFRNIADIELVMPNGGAWKWAEAICGLVGTLTEELVDADAMAKDSKTEIRVLSAILKQYQQLLTDENLIDFAKIQTECYRLLKENPAILSDLQEKIHYLMIDEYQDTNYIQEQIIFMLGEKHGNICVVGDDDQGLYRFRGATIRNILEFPHKFKDGACKIIPLTVNYRSNSDIVDFYNEWISTTDGAKFKFEWKNFRYPKHIVPFKHTDMNSKAVVKLASSEDEDEWHDKILDFIHKLKDSGKLTDYNQLAFLFSSVKSQQVTSLANFLEANGINVYSPRSDMFFKRREIMLTIGCLMLMFPLYVQGLIKGEHKYLQTEHSYYYRDCIELANELLSLEENKELKKFIRSRGKSHAALAQSKGTTDYAYSGLLYQLFAFKPFSTILDTDLSSGVVDVRPARNIAMLTQIVGKFEYLHRIDVFTDKYINKNTELFFNLYMRLLFDGGISEYEDDSEYAPSGCVSFMTIHQSKGMEFPIVIVDSLGNTPRKSYKDLLSEVEVKYYHRPQFEPFEEMKFFDFWRLYYTAFSRAQDLLVLTCNENNRTPSLYFRELYDELPSIESSAFDLNEFTFHKVKAVNIKDTFSFTSHITVYETCSLQYKFYKELEFMPIRENAMMFGTLVHETIEDIHRAAIRQEEHLITPDNVSDWFESNYVSLVKSEHTYLAEPQKKAALKQVLRYVERQHGDWSMIKQAEVDVSLVQPEYIIEGKIDLIKGADGTVELVDFKSERKPDMVKARDRIEHYRRQLHIYAFLVEQRTGQKVSKMHLYYTGEENGNPMISFPYTKSAIEGTVSAFDDTVHKIMKKDFSRQAESLKTCTGCDFRFYCQNK